MTESDLIAMARCPLFHISLPFPPSVNHMYEPGYRGKRVLTRRAKLFRETVVALVIDRANRLKAPLPIVGAVAVEIVAHPPDEKRRDVDNLLKATLDALQAARVFCDDRQVEHLTIRWGWHVNDGSLEVRIGRIEHGKAVAVASEAMGIDGRRAVEKRQIVRGAGGRDSSQQ